MKLLKAHPTDGPRKIVLKGGSIHFQETCLFQETSLGCFVLNISIGGAGLVLDSNTPIPLSFDLEIDGERLRHRCHVVWRNDCHLGISFDLDRRPPTAFPANPNE